jgi:hypothetical protein
MTKLAAYPRPLTAVAARLASSPGATVSRISREAAPRLPFGLALLAVVLQLTLSGNSLNDLGLHYSLEGGNPLFKFHPATYLTFCAAAVAILSLPRGKSLGFFTQRLGLTAFLLVTVASSVWSVSHVGFSGSAVFVESYLSAGALAIVLDMADAQQRRLLAKTILWLLVLNVAIAIYEGLVQTHLIPIFYSEEDRLKGISHLDVQDGEFRGAALYTHPLSGALFTAMGVFLVIALNLSFASAAALFGILGIGLLAFGGRAALLITGMLLVVKGATMMLHDLVSRRWNPGLMAAVLLSIFVVLPVGAIIVAETPIGDRIVNRFYYDDSAQVRASQWRVFDKLDRSDLMFGVPVAKQESLIFNARAEAIENPLILMFFSLGMPALIVFLLGCGAFLWYLNAACPNGRWLLFAVLLIISTNNSVGTKCSDLFVMTACLFATRLGPQLSAERSRSKSRYPSGSTGHRTAAGNLAASPQPRRGLIASTPATPLRGLTPESTF